MGYSLGLIGRDGEVSSGLGRVRGGERKRRMSEFAAGEADSEGERRAGDGFAVCWERVGRDPGLEVYRAGFDSPSDAV